MSDEVACKIHAVVGDEYAQKACELLKSSASLSNSCTLRLEDNPEHADIILLIARPEGDPSLKEVRRDRVFRSLRRRCIVYCEHDNAVPILTGIYTGASAQWLDSANTVP